MTTKPPCPPMQYRDPWPSSGVALVWLIFVTVLLAVIVSQDIFR